ncbi:NADPH-dependent F420 reductase [Parahaliea mediterranea]|uniref:NADPH-dependent F420 reductase n=1 Tax=Parahaliea mediterranea TaxID=651086 RepID=UPI0013004BA8|nr:NAD(P)-binding domain-containing protein [Parahaliea mediterranea]
MRQVLWSSVVALLLAVPMPDAFSAGRVVAVIGTGDMGDSIGPKLAEKGYQVVYGSRDPGREAVRALVARSGQGASAALPLAAAQQGEIVVLAVPWPAMATVARNLGSLDGKIVVDISTPARQAADGYLQSQVDTSSAELIQQWNPGARVVKTVLAGSFVIDDPLVLGERTSTFIAADDRAAKEVVARLAFDLGIEPVDAGPLRLARDIEAWARLWFVPAIQKRRLGFELRTLPNSHWYCIWDDEWYAPVADSDNLAQFPTYHAAVPPCPAP